MLLVVSVGASATGLVLLLGRGFRIEGVVDNPL